jgi:hypothetical protein
MHVLLLLAPGPAAILLAVTPASCGRSYDSVCLTQLLLPLLSLQVLGANALLLRCLIDCTGTIARCAGPRFSSNTKLLRGALLPLFERLADPCPLVAAAAGTALASICRHCGYPLGLGQLVGRNADYVVDGVCKRLRSLQQYPRAPQLLAALLRESGVGAQLLPLLAEPLRAALSVSAAAAGVDSALTKG